MLSILSLIAGLGSLICCIIILIPLFQEKGALHGILGIITCGIYAFIWGWMNATRLGKKNIMLIWTACYVVSFVLNFMGAAAAFRQGAVQ